MVNNSPVYSQNQYRGIVEWYYARFIPLKSCSIQAPQPIRPIPLRKYVSAISFRTTPEILESKKLTLATQRSYIGGSITATLPSGLVDITSKPSGRCPSFLDAK